MSAQGGGGCLPRGVCRGGGSAPGEGCLPRGRGVCLEGVHLPLWTEFLTHTCESIIFPQLRLRTVTTRILPDLFSIFVFVIGIMLNFDTNFDVDTNVNVTCEQGFMKKKALK